MADDDANEGRQQFHYEHGVPVFDVGRVDKLERATAEAESRDREYKDEQLNLNREQLKINKWMMRFTAATGFLHYCAYRKCQSDICSMIPQTRIPISLRIGRSLGW